MLEPDLRHARSFVQALTGSPSTVLCFQTFDDSPAKRSELAATIWGSLDEADTIAALTDLNSRGAGVYLTVNEINGGRPLLDNGEVCRRLAVHVTRIRALFIDCDGVEPDLSDLPAPSITVRSARGPHHYWIAIPEPPVEQFKHAQRSLALRLGTDVVVNDPCRVMRLPGFYHRKRDPFLVTLEHPTGAI